MNKKSLIVVVTIIIAVSLYVILGVSGINYPSKKYVLLHDPFGILYVGEQYPCLKKGAELPTDIPVGSSIYVRNESLFEVEPRGLEDFFKTLSKLSDKESSICGFVGLMQLSLYMGNTSNLYEWISFFSSKYAENKHLNQIIDYYLVQYYFDTGLYDDAKTLIDKHDNAIKFDNHLREIRYLLFVRENKLHEAKDILDKISQDKDTTLVPYLTLTHTNIVNGTPGSLQDLLNEYSDESTPAGVKFHYAIAIGDIDYDKKKELLNEIARNNDIDIKLILEIVNEFANEGDYAGAEKVLSKLNIGADEVDFFIQFPMYRLIMSKFDMLDSDFNSMRKNLSEALSQSGSNIEILWHSYYVYSEVARDNDDLIYVLKKLYNFDNYSPYILHTLYKESVFGGCSSLAEKVAGKIHGLNRYKPDYIIKEINSHKNVESNIMENSEYCASISSVFGS